MKQMLKNVVKRRKNTILANILEYPILMCSNMKIGICLKNPISVQTLVSTLTEPISDSDRGQEWLVRGKPIKAVIWQTNVERRSYIKM